MKRLFSIGSEGFTLIEVVLTGAIATIVFLAVGGIMKWMITSTQRVDEDFNAVTTELSGITAIWYDARKNASFGMLDDLDENNRPFWEYRSDAPCLQNCSRRIALIPGQGAVTFLTEITSFGSSIPLNPTTFFSSTPAPTSGPNFPNGSGTLTYNEGQLINIIATQRPRFLDPGTMLQFYSPVSMRRITAGGVNMNTSARQPSYIVITDGAGFTAVPASSGITAQAHPATGLAYTSLRGFFEGMPPDGGRSAFVMVRPVRLVRYTVEAVNHNAYDTGRLMRSVYDTTITPPAWSPPSPVVVPVCGVEFVRTNITVPSVRPTIFEDRNARDRSIASDQPRIRSSCPAVLPNTLMLQGEDG